MKTRINDLTKVHENAIRCLEENILKLENANNIESIIELDHIIYHQMDLLNAIGILDNEEEWDNLVDKRLNAFSEAFSKLFNED